MAKKKKLNKAWLGRHMNDPYVKLAQQHGYRSRAAYKLRGVDDQDQLIRPGMRVLDLGATPGAWCQVLRERLTTTQGRLNGRILALDLVPMDPIAEVEFILGDFREQQVLDLLERALDGDQLDLVLSDMAPNLSGVAAADAARMTDLAELALDFAQSHLKPDGMLLAKCFHGSGYSQVVEGFKRVFHRVAPRKPAASRPESAETFLLGRGLRQRD